MSSQFRDTPFNLDCPHHKVHFTTKPTHCVYCQAPAHWYIRERNSQIFWTTVWLACVIGYLVWLFHAHDIQVTW